MIAEQTGVHDTIGIDLVAMSVNDVAVQGAEPLFFLDYLVTGRLEPVVVEALVSGIADGCRRAGCALIGGEIAEHPGHMPPGSFDLAGFCVGAVERDRLITGAGIRARDALIGFESSGLHANGYSLVRRVLLEDAGMALDAVLEGLGSPLGEELLRPTLIYAPALLRLREDVELRGLAHITGGGIPENLGRVLPAGVGAVLHRGSWPIPPIFDLVARTGNVAEAEMLSTFNMGIGMIAVVPAGSVEEAMESASAAGLRPHTIGEIAEGPEGVRFV
jgi:phosphoribosylformylglycinamidine cyclo-ligase